MNAMEAILTRRSIRSFTGQDVEPEKVGQMLKAAMYAPSAHNSQDWSFIVVRDPQTRAALSRLTPYCGMITNAPVCIVVCGEPARQRAGRKEFFVQDCFCRHAELLRPPRAGAGAVWCGVYPTKRCGKSARPARGARGGRALRAGGRGLRCPDTGCLRAFPRRPDSRRKVVNTTLRREGQAKAPCCSIYFP